MKQAILGGMVAWLMACSGNGTDASVHLPALSSYDFYVSTSTDAQFQAAVQLAASEWREFTGVKINLYTGSHVCVVGCFNIFEPSEQVLNAATLEQGYVGYTVPGYIAVGGGLSWDETQETMTHEMGHALGLVHHSTYAVMNPDYSSAAKHVVCDDVSQFFSERGKSVPKTGIKPCTNAPGELPDAGAHD